MTIRTYLRALFSKEAFRTLIRILVGMPITNFDVRHRYFGELRRDDKAKGDRD